MTEVAICARGSKDCNVHRLASGDWEERNVSAKRLRGKESDGASYLLGPIGKRAVLDIRSDLVRLSQIDIM